MAVTWSAVRFLFLLFLSAAFTLSAHTEFAHHFASDISSPRFEVVKPLLEAVCPGEIRTDLYRKQVRVGCGDSPGELLPPRPRRYPVSDSVQMPVDGVIFGHFLGPHSQDALLSTETESHPSLWRGTILLTRRNGNWTALWYKPGMVTRYCHRLRLPSRREVLLCEESDGGMGHSVQLLYTVDALYPEESRRSVLFETDNYSGVPYGGLQVQRIARVEFVGTAGATTGLRVLIRHGRVPWPHTERGRAEWDIALERRPRTRQYWIRFKLRQHKFVLATDSLAVWKKLIARV